MNFIEPFPKSCVYIQKDKYKSMCTFNNQQKMNGFSKKYTLGKVAKRRGPFSRLLLLRGAGGGGNVKAY